MAPLQEAFPMSPQQLLALLSPVSHSPQADPHPSASGLDGVIPPGSGWGPCLIHICILGAWHIVDAGTKPGDYELRAVRLDPSPQMLAVLGGGAGK